MAEHNLLAHIDRINYVFKSPSLSNFSSIFKYVIMIHLFIVRASTSFSSKLFWSSVEDAEIQVCSSPTAVTQISQYLTFI